MIYRNILEETDAGQIWISGMTICDGMAADFAEKKEKIAPAFNFTDGIISTARNIAARYKSDELHHRNVEKNCLLLFDAVKKQNNLTKHDKLLLQISAILHNCGNFINMNAVGENSYKIVMSTEIIGLSHKERVMVAYMIRYLDSSFPKYAEISDVFSQQEFIKIAKLNSILLLADAMDRSHKQKFANTTVYLRGSKLLITGKTLYDITLEQGIFDNNSDFFEELYGIKPILKQKKEF